MATYPIYRSSKGGQDVYVGEITKAPSAVSALETWAEHIGIDDYSVDQAPGRIYVCPANSVLFYYTYTEVSWEPEYESWRHGGWYVTNVRYPSGAVGCVSRNYDDRKWRIVCDPREGSYAGGQNDHTYPSRDAAARAEHDLTVAMSDTPASVAAL